ncbi:hypothetical protein DVR12_18445 [Chitinophaga silvatica]|uniref:HMA domain-containing protein n=1 Tax=Chitinophaga silvatica TaxID=2282649 RepID=A0A3E1Y6H7_9BACT|nr:hypothetical protein [Chitinophaga silvatica]RFS20546.1 hypothetical protein DVR12_18445 [Chitinophaga silvatica]
MLGIFKTNINTNQDKNTVINAISTQIQVKACTIDLEDCDKVLRIDSPMPFTTQSIINVVTRLGFNCEILK